MSVTIFKNSQLQSMSSQNMSPIAISVAFYNNLKNFEFMLAALEQQTQRDFLLIIADDGSKPEVVQQVHEKLEKFSRPAMHLWHEDRGFRKNRMLNWVIYHSPVEYLVFVDQDCLPHPSFLEDHWSHRQVGHVLCGRRMELTPWQSSLLTVNSIKQGILYKNLWLWALTGFWKKDTNFPKAIRLSIPAIQKFFNKKDRPIVGCNFSISRTDMLKINGFDFRYEAAGTGEDSDIDFRLSLAGVKRKPLTHLGVQYHVFHKLTPKNDVNEALFAKVQKEGKAFTDFGIEQQLKGF